MPERERGIPTKINVKKPPPPEPETLESKIDPERKKLLDSLTIKEQIYVYRRLKEQIKSSLARQKPASPTPQKEEEEHSPLFKATDALLSQISRRTFRPEEMVDPAEKYTTIGFTTPHPEELRELTPEEIRELGLEGAPLVRGGQSQGSIFGNLLASKLTGMFGNFLSTLASSPKVQDAVANFLNALAKAGGKE